MRTSAIRAAAAAAVFTLVAAACGGGDDPPSTPATSDPAAGTVIELVVVGNELEGGARRESAPLGTEVTIRVSGDSDDEVHVHGYDVSVDLVDGAGELTFPALIPGVFEIELEEAGTLLVQLEVS
jgi:ethanolamine utilization microcompartment shell protein EutL